MKWLSVRQPWASFIAMGLKPVENRSRAINYRGPVVLHASASAPDYVFSPNLPQDSHLARAAVKVERIYPPSKAGGTWLAMLPYGAAIAVVDIVGCVKGYNSPWADPGAHHIILANPRPLSFLVPFRGRQGLFEGPDVDALNRPHDGTTRRVNLRHELADLAITRPGKWGNPYKIKGQVNVKTGATRYWVEAYFHPACTTFNGYFPDEQTALAKSLEMYEADTRKSKRLMGAIRSGELHGKRLGCFCEAGAPCHGDVLVKLDREVNGK
jgi:hypothetical protein